MDMKSAGAGAPDAPSRWDGALGVLFGIVAALLFFYVLRGTGSRAPLALLLNGNGEAGAAKLAAYAFIGGGIAMFVMKLSARLGFFALVALVLTLLGVLIGWGLLPRITEDLPFMGAPLAMLVLAFFAFKAWQQGAASAPLTRSARTLALGLGIPVILLGVWIVALRPLFF